MKNKFRWILLLMCVSMLLLAALQFYWNYQNYLISVRNFKADINAALKTAVSLEKEHRIAELQFKMKNLIADTSVITIKAYIDTTYKNTTFSIADTHPPYPNRTPFKISFKAFKQKINTINPEAKKFFIEKFITDLVKSGLERGEVYYYTERFGDSLAKAYNQNKLNLKRLKNLYTKELSLRAINTPYILNPTNIKQKDYPFTTLKYNAALQKPNIEIKAYFPNPNLVILQQMKWVIFASVFLIALTLYSFAYTAKILLSQDKLAEIKNNFITNMTHEIKTPLTSIAITAQALQQFDNDGVKRAEYLKIINYQINKLDDLTEVLLNSSRITETSTKLFEVTNLDLLINEAISNLKPQLQAANGSLNFKSGTPNVNLKANYFDLLHAIINLIDNAIKYTETQPTIILETKLVNKVIYILISDNGIGIEPIYTNQIFDKFFRIPTGNLHNVKGNGLGLSYVKTVLEQHKGEIYYKSTLKVGSTFTIKLPSVC